MTTFDVLVPMVGVLTKEGRGGQAKGDTRPMGWNEWHEMLGTVPSSASYKVLDRYRDGSCTLRITTEDDAWAAALQAALSQEGDTPQKRDQLRQTYMRAGFTDSTPGDEAG